jgi:hypothetical protein
MKRHGRLIWLQNDHANGTRERLQQHTLRALPMRSRDWHAFPEKCAKMVCEAVREEQAQHNETKCIWDEKRSG